MKHVLRKNTFFLIFLFLLAFIVRALVFGGYLSKNQRYWQVDSGYYHEIATQIADGNGITTSNGTPSFYRLPGYSLFLSACYAILGKSKEHALWLQVALASFIPVLIMLLCLILFPGHMLLARGVGLYSAIHLGLVLYSGFFMTETLFILTLLLFMLLFFSKLHLFSGIVLGCASMIRPVGHYLIVLALLLIVFSSDRIREKLRYGLALVCGWLVVVSPWLIRNYALAGSIFFHTLPGGHFLYLSAARVAMHAHNVSYWEARDLLSVEVEEKISQREVELKKKLNEIERCREHISLAVHYFKKYPLLALKNWLTDMMRTSLSLYSAEIVFLESGRKEIDYFNKERTIWSMFKRHFIPQTDKVWLKIVVWGEIILFFFILLGFAMNACRWLWNLVHYRLTDNYVWIRVLPFMCLFIFISLSGGYARMRLPIEPLLIIMSLQYWFERKRSV